MAELQACFVKVCSKQLPCTRNGDGFSSARADDALSRFNIDFVVSLLRQENAKDICVIQVSPELRYCEYFIIVSGSSTRHLHAMAEYMLKMYKCQKEEGDSHNLILWICDGNKDKQVTAGNIVVHFMLPETRERYELEKLWTLHSYDDQLAQMMPQLLPEDFILGLAPQEQ
ncbi:PREDICTED: mitochondrial assembly of ribosomal large subunit protein 1 [Tinamus guttatus]|uniref:mitochondrial assembly of ribosomal large subunit protein 1 n=1 Tax=Tinamus guttatus TaxID=94827 RepID=UPI00052EB3CC|nr:PREDICTED: mitochondrial assembly of ribosomal large subunit protein 1 [Tinamus guttatus]